jgi:hypothetical protein
VTSRSRTAIGDKNGEPNVTAVEVAAINAIAPLDAPSSPVSTLGDGAVSARTAGAALGTPSGFGTSLQQAMVQAGGFATVTLGQMIASRINSGTGSLTGAAGGLGGDQAPGITRGSGTVAVASSRGSLDVPEVLQTYGNGRIPKEMLTPIGIGQHRLWSVAAGAFVTMRAAAAADGVDIGVTDSYRAYDQQVELAANKGLYKNGGLGAVPGTSPHGWGLALDVDVDPKGLAWLRANGASFGFAETTPREPWHWEFRGAT